MTHQCIEIDFEGRCLVSNSTRLAMWTDFFALHAEETEFRLIVDSATPVIGKLAAREQFKNVFLSNPGYSSTVGDIQFGPNLVYIRYLMCMGAEMPPKLYDVDSFLVIRIYRISRDNCTQGY